MRNLVTFALIFLYLPLRLDCLGEDEDPYNILGVSRSASQADIKRAYKKMARNWSVNYLYLLAIFVLISNTF